MDIHHLKVFTAVFRNRSFSKASTELHLTQPTVSDHVRALEDTFKCRLFDRLGRTIIPTREAELLYSRAEELIEKADSLKELIDEFRKEVSGTLVMGASTIPGTYLLPRIISGFRSRHPAGRFEIVESDSRGIVERILKHELLLGIVGTTLTNEQLQFMPVMEDDLIVVSSPSLIKKNRISLEELTTFPVVLREEGSGTRKEMERILEGKGIMIDELKLSGLFGSTDAVKQAVKAGLGISILSEMSVIDELKYKILKKIEVTDVRMRRKFYAVKHRKRSLPLPYTIFLDYLKAYLKTEGSRQ